MFSIVARVVLVVVGACLAMLPAQVIAGCPATWLYSHDRITERLQVGIERPQSVSNAERNCLAGIVGQALDLYPQGRQALDAAVSPELTTFFANLSVTGSLDSPADRAVYQQLLAAFESVCTPDIRKAEPRSLTAEEALRCGLIVLPGAPPGLGRYVAQFESGNAVGGYESISGDPGAGGWTYGKYQMAADAGGISGFLDALLCRNTTTCLPQDFRRLGRQLEAAGGLDAARKATSEFSSVWISLSQNDRMMQQAQESYQALKVWQPAAKVLSDLGIDPDEHSCGLREAALSVYTQHKASSSRAIFGAAAATSGLEDDAAIIRAANAYRLVKLGEPGGFYTTYGDICSGRNAPTAETSKQYACSYLDGVRKRWTEESRLLSSPALSAPNCPQ